MRNAVAVVSQRWCVLEATSMQGHNHHQSLSCDIIIIRVYLTLPGQYLDDDDEYNCDDDYNNDDDDDDDDDDDTGSVSILKVLLYSDSADELCLHPSMLMLMSMMMNDDDGDDDNDNVVVTGEGYCEAGQIEVVLVWQQL